VLAMRQLPDWSWTTLILLQLSLAGVAGLLSGVIARKPMKMIEGLFVYPISSTLVSFIVAGFFYYCFFFFLRRELPMRVLFSNVIFAHLPAMVLYTLSPLVPPLILVGLSVTGILVI